MASEPLSRQLTQLEDRLSRDFAPDRVNVFVPFLVERAVRTTLSASPAEHRRH
jgi:hypothetical protein